jgi:hypothetical protein
VKLTTHLNIVPKSRMRGAIPPHLQYVFMAWCLVKQRDNFTFTLPPVPPVANTTKASVTEMWNRKGAQTLRSRVRITLGTNCPLMTESLQ